MHTYCTLSHIVIHYICSAISRSVRPANCNHLFRFTYLKVHIPKYSGHLVGIVAVCCCEVNNAAYFEAGHLPCLASSACLACPCSSLRMGRSHSSLQKQKTQIQKYYIISIHLYMYVCVCVCVYACTYVYIYIQVRYSSRKIRALS